MAEVPLPFAGALRGLRTQAGLTQEELADAAGLSPRAVGDLERGMVAARLAAGRAAEGEAWLRQALGIFQRIGAAEAADVAAELDAYRRVYDFKSSSMERYLLPRHRERWARKVHGGAYAVSDLSRIFNDLIRFEIAIWDAVDGRLKSELRLPLTHYEPMSVIHRVPDCRVYDIAVELGITPGGVSKLVDRIEASGYCRRLPNPSDRRSSIVELTADGERVLAAAAEVLEDELEQWLGRVLPERTLRQFGSTLARLRAADHGAEIEATA